MGIDQAHYKLLTERVRKNAECDDLLSFISRSFIKYFEKNPLKGKPGNWANFNDLSDKINDYYNTVLNHSTNKEDVVNGRYLSELYGGKNTHQTKSLKKIEAIAEFFLSYFNTPKKEVAPTNNALNSGLEEDILNLLPSIKLSIERKRSAKDNITLLNELIAHIDEPSETLLNKIAIEYRTCTGCAHNYELCNVLGDSVSHLLEKAKYTNADTIKILITDSKTSYLKGDFDKLKNITQQAGAFSKTANLGPADKAEVTDSILDLEGYLSPQAIPEKMKYIFNLYAGQQTSTKLLTAARCAACKSYIHNNVNEAKEHATHAQELLNQAKKEKNVPLEDITHNHDALILINLLGELYTNTIDEQEFKSKCQKQFGNTYKGLAKFKGQTVHIAYLSHKLSELETRETAKWLKKFSFEKFSKIPKVENFCLVPLNLFSIQS